MARAIAIQNIDSTVSGDSINLSYRVLFYGADMPNGQADASLVSFAIAATDTLVQTRDAFVDAIIAEADRLGYPVTRGRVIIPGFQRGA